MALTHSIRRMILPAILAALSITLISSAATSQTRNSRHCDPAGPATQFGQTYVCVSSHLAPQAGNNYHAAMSYDGDPATAWVEGASNSGIGEWIELVFEREMRVQTIELIAGYAKNQRIFFANARPAAVQVLADGVPIDVFYLADSMGFQTLRLDRPIDTTRLRLWVGDARNGARWSDLGISEIYADLEEHAFR